MIAREIYRCIKNNFLLDKSLPFVKNLLISKNLKFAYLQIPKCGCSTMKYNLLKLNDSDLTQEELHNDRLHWSVYGSRDLEEIFERDAELCLPVITSVRNPFARILSAYREKIELQLDLPKYKMDLGFEKNERPDFKTFIDVLVKSNPLSLDAHFQPQSLIIPEEIFDDCYVVYMESMDSQLKNFIRLLIRDEKSMSVSVRDVHSTGASSKKIIDEYYRDKSIALKVIDFFEEDFELIGYSKELQLVGIAPKKDEHDGKAIPLNPFYKKTKVKLDQTIRRLFNV